MKFNKTTLENGLRIITVPMKDNPTVTVLVMVETGSRYETKDINGLSHFLEHMVFKGTKNRPKAVDISRELDEIGAEYNAFTSNEYTGYYAKVEKRHTNKALDIVSDMYLNPLFNQAEIEKEKGVITEEIKMYEDLPQRLVGDVFDELLYSGSPLGFTVLGPVENIKSFNREHFLNYRKEHYVSSSTVIVVAGDIDEKSIIEDVKNIFKDISTTEKGGRLSVKENQSSPKIKLAFKDTSQAHLIIGLRTFDINDKRRAILRVLSAVLGGGMSSRLWLKMRDELGICYYVRSSNNLYTDCGNLAISAGVDNKRVKIAIENILKEIKRFKDEIVSEKELRKAKDLIAGRMMLNLETSDSWSDFVADQEIMSKKIETPEEKIKKIESVTSEDIKNLANELFIDSGLNLAMIGPFKDEKEFLPLLTFGQKSNEDKSSKDKTNNKKFQKPVKNKKKNKNK